MLLALLPALFLAACAPPPQSLDPAGYAPLDHQLPLAARFLLPRGIPPGSARFRENCYAYEYNGTLYPIRRPGGAQYCI